eukprot:6711845-Pyramimonas_sp.AAC.1
MIFASLKLPSVRRPWASQRACRRRAARARASANALKACVTTALRHSLPGTTCSANAKECGAMPSRPKRA